MQNEGKGAMHTFTREFYHPVDRVPEVSPAAAERFHADCRRFPPGALMKSIRYFGQGINGGSLARLNGARSCASRRQWLLQLEGGK